VLFALQNPLTNLFCAVFLRTQHTRGGLGSTGSGFLRRFRSANTLDTVFRHNVTPCAARTPAELPHDPTHGPHEGSVSRGLSEGPWAPRGDKGGLASAISLCVGL